MGTVAAPEPLADSHDVSRFNSGVPGLDAWLQGKARLNEAKGGARTFVTCDDTRVVGFYSLAASAVERRRIPSRVGRSMPEPVPVILLGQLAVDTDYQGFGLESDLLVDAAKRALSAAEFIGARAIVAYSGEADHRFRRKADHPIRSSRSPVGAKRRGSVIMGRGDRMEWSYPDSVDR